MHRKTLHDKKKDYADSNVISEKLWECESARLRNNEDNRCVDITRAANALHFFLKGIKICKWRNYSCAAFRMPYYAVSYKCNNRVKLHSNTLFLLAAHLYLISSAALSFECFFISIKIL